MSFHRWSPRAASFYHASATPPRDCKHCRAYDDKDVHSRGSVMGKASVDPGELRRFAQDLNRFNNELHALMAGLHARLRNLESTWRDQEQRKFTEAFEQTTKVLANFLEASRDHVTFLGK